MTTLPDFKLETHFSKWEFKARYHMTASDAQSMSLRELLEMATEQEREAFEGMWLGYTETFGAPDLRERISRNFTQRDASQVLCFAGASEGIYAANQVLLEPDSHAIVITPNYQSHETLPVSICEASAVALDPNDGWSLDVDQVAASIRKNTRLLTMNFPHNPTGANLPQDRFDALLALCDKHGIYILSDEIFRGLGPGDATYRPPVADVYERGLSLDVTSKAYGLPGLRIGWIACADKSLLARMERIKHYLSICNSGPSERLAIIALRNRDRIFARNCAIIDENLVHLNAFFAGHGDLFDWRQPDASCMGFPRYLGSDGVEAFTRDLVERSGVLLLPASVYRSALGETPTDHFRIGFGRSGIAEGLAVMQAHLSGA